MEFHRTARRQAVIGHEASSEVIYFPESLSPQEPGRHPAAAPRGAIGQNGLVRIQFPDAVGKFRQGDEGGPGKMPVLIFPGLAHIQQRVAAFRVLRQKAVGLLCPEHGHL
jgi:hypothetical protein